MILRTDSVPSGKGELSAKQVRAARALLAWSQQDLAARAGIAVSTVADFERGQRTPVPNNAEAIRRALEEAGIRFLPEGAVIGPALPRLGSTTKSGAPISWITVTDLAQWAERLDGRGSLPSVLAKLVRAGGWALPHFPSDEGIQFGGWDGVTRAEIGSDYVPVGTTGWEIGTQREGISGKADEDYNKRAKNPGPLNPSESTFIFVTPRYWPEKDSWAANKRSQGVWRDVRAYDGTDLIDWIGLYPAVGQALAVALGKRPPGARQLEEIWKEWSLATSPPLTPEVILADRDQDVVAVLKWLRNDPTILPIQGETAEEVAAFVYAAIRELPVEDAGHYLARTLVAESPSVARTLGDSRTRLVVVLLEPEPGLAQAITQNGHHVLLAYSGPHHLSDIRKLTRPTREGIESALEAAAVPEDRAKRLAREASRSLAVLRRLMASLSDRLPGWAQSAPPHALLGALLTGGWDERSEADRRAAARLADMPYETFAVALAQFTGPFDRPLRKVGSTWKVNSPQDAWLLLAPYLTPVDVDRFEEVVGAVLATADPRYSMSGEERWYAPLKDVRPEYSEHLRRGLGEILIMFALFGNRVQLVPDADRRADRVVYRLLNGADDQRWWSLSGDFQLLAEAAPERFLEAVQLSLDQPTPPIAALLKSDPDPTFGREYLSNLLWALESLARSPRYLGQVARILAQLDQMDPGGRYKNRPGNSLRELFVLWLPQTGATLAERLKVLDMLRKRYGAVAWKLMLGILPSGHDALSPAATPRWRDLAPETAEEVTYALIQQGAYEVSSRLLTDVELDVERWTALLERIGNVSDRNELIRSLASAAARLGDEGERTRLWAVVRRTLHNHRQIPDAKWTLPASELAELDKVYAVLTPSDPVTRTAWLFGGGAGLPNPVGGWRGEDEQRKVERQKAGLEILQTQGVNGVLALAEAAQDPLQLGVALIAAGIAVRERDLLLERSLKSASDHLHGLAHGMVAMTFQTAKKPWFGKLVAKAQAEAWGDRAVLTLLCAVLQDRWIWTLAASLGADIERQYWRRVAAFAIEATQKDIPFVAQKLTAAGRARHALELLVHRLSDTVPGKPRKIKFPDAILVEVLREAARQPWEDPDQNSVVMFQHSVAQLLKRLDAAKDVSEETMLELEWTYLRLLEYSERPPKAIMRALARDPDLFVQLLCGMYKPSPESGVEEPPPADPTAAKRFAEYAFNILRQWDVVPGTNAEGDIDGAALDAWVKQARKLAGGRGRDLIADLKIGEILAASPVGQDGIWPAAPVRDLIEASHSEHLEEGFLNGQHNRRGVTSRLPRDGGKQERDIVKRFEGFTQATALEWPRTSAALARIAKDYAMDARRHDEDSEQVDW